MPLLDPKFADLAVNPRQTRYPQLLLVPQSAVVIVFAVSS